jgi:hypothetical protein
VKTHLGFQRQGGGTDDATIYEAYLSAAEAVRAGYNIVHVGQPELCKKVNLKPGQVRSSTLQSTDRDY